MCVHLCACTLANRQVMQEEDAAVAMPSACLVNVMTTAAHWPPPNRAYGRHRRQRAVARLQPARSTLLRPFQGPATLLRLK